MSVAIEQPTVSAPAGTTLVEDSSASPEMLDFLARQGLAFAPFRAARRPNSGAHNRQETPMFAKSIERHALARK
jgi:hypothetical protein